MEDQEKLIRLGVILEEVVKKVDGIDKKIDNLKIDSRMSVAEDHIADDDTAPIEWNVIAKWRSANFPCGEDVPADVFGCFAEDE